MSIKSKISKEQVIVERNIHDNEYLDDLFDDKVISGWEYKFLIDISDYDTLSDKQEKIQQKLIKKIARSNVIKKLQKMKVL